MKILLHPILLILTSHTLLISCKQAQPDITGIYVRAIDHEFAIGQDTLMIKPVNGNIYQIEKRSHYQRILKDQLQPVESHRTKWAGIYDLKNHLLREAVQGKILVVSQDDKRLILGALEYKRVNGSK